MQGAGEVLARRWEQKRKGSVSLGKVEQMFGSLAAVEQEDKGVLYEETRMSIGHAA